MTIGNIKFGKMTSASKNSVMKRYAELRASGGKSTGATKGTARTGETKYTTTAQPTSVPTTQSFSKLTDSMQLLNSLSGLFMNKSSAGAANSNSTVASNNSNNTVSGIAQGVSSSPYVSSGGDYSKIESQLKSNTFNGAELSQYIKSEVNPYVETAQTNLANAQADYNVLLGQKDKAASDVSNLQSQMGTAETSYKSAEKSLSSNKSHLDSSIKARDEMDEQLSAVNSEYKTSCDNVKTKEQAKSAAQTQVSSCKSGVSQAETNLSSATASYESAEQALKNTPQTLENGSPNPAYTAAVKARDEALEKKNAAQTALTKAKEELKNAEAQLTKAEEELKTAQSSKKEILQKLSQTKSEQSKLASTCNKLEGQVEDAQENYDASLNAYDESKNNYDRLNTELESANGILTQCDQYQAKIDKLKTESDNAQKLKAQADDALKDKDANVSSNAETNARKAQIMENANKSKGCSASKTPAENLLSMEDGPYPLNHMAWGKTLMNGRFVEGYDTRILTHEPIIHDDANFFKEAGCIANSDGSFTNPENGETYIEVASGTWANTSSLSTSSEATQYVQNIRSKYPDAYKTEARANNQRQAGYGYMYDGIRIGDDGKAVLVY